MTLALILFGTCCLLLAAWIVVEDRAEAADTERPALDPDFVERCVQSTRDADRREAANRLSAAAYGRTTGHCDRHGRLGCRDCGVA
jgi:hypothetical protein